MILLAMAHFISQQQLAHRIRQLTQQTTMYDILYSNIIHESTEFGRAL